MFDPDDHYTAGTMLWRYTTLPKFFDLIQTGELYFTRLDSLLDPHEDAVVRAACLRDPQTAETIYVNCWFLNDCESSTMWTAYGGETGIAIRTSIERLKAATNNIGHLGLFGSFSRGPVQYRDEGEMEIFLRTTGPPPTNVAPGFNKRRHFSQEQEYRLAWGLPGAQRQEPCCRLAVDLAELIEQIVVAPDVAPWVTDVVERFVLSHGINSEVVRSSLFDSTPFQSTAGSGVTHTRRSRTP